MEGNYKGQVTSKLIVCNKLDLKFYILRINIWELMIDSIY